MSDCAWCGEPATTKIEIEPQVIGQEKNPITGKSIRVIRKRAIVVDVCAHHYSTLERRETQSRRQA